MYVYVHVHITAQVCPIVDCVDMCSSSICSMVDSVRTLSYSPDDRPADLEDSRAADRPQQRTLDSRRIDECCCVLTGIRVHLRRPRKRGGLREDDVVHPPEALHLGDVVSAVQDDVAGSDLAAWKPGPCGAKKDNTIAANFLRALQSHFSVQTIVL